MYKNSADITSIEGIEVDAGSLWKFDKGLLILIDADQYVSHVRTNIFYLVTDQ